MIKRLTMSYAPGFRIWPEYEVCYDNVRFRVQFKGLWGPWSWTRNGRQLLYDGDTGVLSADRRFEAGIVTEFLGTTVISGDDVFFRPMNQPWFRFSLYRNVGPKKTATDKFDRYAKRRRVATFMPFRNSCGLVAFFPKTESHRADLWIAMLCEMRRSL